MMAITAAGQRWRKENREARNAQSRRWYAKNREARNAQIQVYHSTLAGRIAADLAHQNDAARRRQETIAQHGYV